MVGIAKLDITNRICRYFFHFFALSILINEAILFFKKMTTFLFDILETLF